MTTHSTEDKRPTALEKKQTKIENRKKVFRSVYEGFLIYLSVVCGVLLTESLLDIEKSMKLHVVFSWNRVIIAALISGFFMSQFETGINKIGKKRNMVRRLSHAFSQGAALRGIIEWFFLLFSLS